MKRKVLLALAAALVLGFFCGCGTKKEESVAAETTAEKTAETTAEETTVEDITAEETTALTGKIQTPKEEAETLIRIGALKGPTSMGLAAMMEEHGEYSYAMETAADAITASLVGGDLDIALIPANLASVLYNKTQGEISVIDINTMSVLYIVSSDDSLSAIGDLKGRTIYLTGKGTTPDFVLQYLLNANELSPEDVTLEYKSEATEVASVLAEDPDAIGLLPQPFVTVACAQNENLKVVISLGEQWEKAQMAEEKASSLVTGVTVVRNEFLQNHEDLVAAFLEAHQASSQAVNANPAAASVKIAELGIVAKAPIAEKAIPYCGITCITGTEMKTALEGYLQVLYEQNPQSVGGKLPEADFYYGAE